MTVDLERSDRGLGHRYVFASQFNAFKGIFICFCTPSWPTNRELKSGTYIVTSIEIDIKSEVLYIGASYVCYTYCNGLPPKEKRMVNIKMNI